MKYPDFRKAPEGATHWDSVFKIIDGGYWCNKGGFWLSEDSYVECENCDWGTDRYIPIPVVDWSKAPEGLNYAYTTGPDWSCSPTCVGTVEFANVMGYQLDEDDTQLMLGEASWVLLETNPKIRVKEKPTTLSKEYKILEVFVDDLSMPFRYRGYWGSLHTNLTDNLLYGSIAQIKDFVSYEADTIAGIKEAFIDAVDDYILTRGELDND